MIPKKKTFIEHAEKEMRRKSKHITTRKKNQRNTKEGSRGVMRDQKKPQDIQKTLSKGQC